MPVTSDTARAISILASLLWAAGVAGARQCRLELGLDHRLDELTHPIAQADFDRIKPIVEEMDRRLGLRLQGCRVRAIAGHGVVSTGAQNAGIVWVSAPGDYATFNSNHTPDGTSTTFDLLSPAVSTTFIRLLFQCVSGHHKSCSVLEFYVAIAGVYARLEDE